MTRNVCNHCIGNPGSSFAVEVARRIGLSEDIIIDSYAKIGEDFINMDSFLQSITRDKLYWEDKRKELENVKAQEYSSQLEKDKPDKPTKVQPIKSTTIEKGDSVKLNGQSTIGIVLELQGKQATVAFGSIKSTLALNRLELVSKA